MNAPRELDVVIVGGGIVGAAAAFFLSRARFSVALVEQGLIGGQASGVNFGNVRRQGRFLPQLPLAHRSRQIWAQLNDLIGDACEFVASGHLRLAFTKEQADDLDDYARQARDWGLDLEFLERDRLQRRFPYLSTAVLAGSLSPHDGQANPRLVAPAFAAAARSLGASILEYSEVRQIVFRDGAFHVVIAGGERIRADVLVNAAGAWGAEIAALFGDSVDVVAKGPQMAVTGPIPPLITEVLGTVDRSVFLRQVPRGNIVLSGGPDGPASLRERRAQSIPATALDMFRSALKVVPALRGANVIRCWSGVEGFTSDGLPVIGPSVSVPGLFHAFAFCGHGFQVGPGVGAVLADLIIAGKSDTPIDPFSIARFLPAAQVGRAGPGAHA